MSKASNTCFVSVNNTNSLVTKKELRVLRHKSQEVWVLFYLDLCSKRSRECESFYVEKEQSYMTTRRKKEYMLLVNMCVRQESGDCCCASQSLGVV